MRPVIARSLATSLRDIRLVEFWTLRRKQFPTTLVQPPSTYLIIFVEPDSADLIDNALYALEVPAAEWRSGTALREASLQNRSLREAFDGYNTSFLSYPRE